MFSKLKSLIDNKDSGYTFETIDDVKLVINDNNIYIPMSMRTNTLHSYHYMINHFGGDRLGNTMLGIHFSVIPDRLLVF